MFKSIISAHDHVNSMPKDKAIAIATDKCSREKHSTQCTSPPWSNEKIAINKKQVSSQLFKCCKNTRHGAGGGTRTHTSVTPTDFESASSTIPTHRHCCVIIQHGTRKFKKKLPKLCHFSDFICSLRCLQRSAREAAMFSFWTRMWSGTFRCLGAKFQMARIPLLMSRSQTL